MHDHLLFRSWVTYRVTEVAVSRSSRIRYHRRCCLLSRERDRISNRMPRIGRCKFSSSCACIRDNSWMKVRVWTWIYHVITRRCARSILKKSLRSWARFVLRRLLKSVKYVSQRTNYYEYLTRQRNIILLKENINLPNVYPYHRQ